ncbi:MAG: PAS domain-containing protein, partial [Rhodobacterales bacterium]|nr:PAS domain-containing protein [Rhodobacterales bacterium]
MNPVAAPDAPRPSTETPEADGILNALATAIITVDADTVIRHVNNAAEQFLQGSQAVLVGLPLTDLMPA